MPWGHGEGGPSYGRGGGAGRALCLVEVVVMVVVFMVVVVLVSLDGLAGLALVHHHGGQLPHVVPPHDGAAHGQGRLQATAPCLALLGSVLVLLVPEGRQRGKQGRAGGQVGGRGRRGDGGSQRGFASRPSRHVAHTHTLALGFGGPHKVLAPVLGAAEPLLDLRDLGEGSVKKVEGAGVGALGLPVRDADGLRLVGARSSGVGGAGGQF